MNNYSISDNYKFCKSLSYYSAVFAIVIGALALAGWTFDIQVLKSILPKFSSMNPTTAMCFILLSGSLLIHHSSYNDPLKRSIATICSLLVLVVALSRLGAILFDFSFSPDRLFFVAKLGNNHIAPNTAFNFFLLSTAQLMLRYPNNLLRHAFIIAAILGSFMALVGYAYDVHALYEMPAFISMALNTATAFFILSCGMLCMEPGYGLIGVLTNEGISGVMSRQLLPRSIIALVLLGWLRLMGQRYGLYNPEIGVLIFLFFVIIIFVVLIWQNALLLERVDLERQSVARDFKESEHRLNLALDSAQLGAWDLDIVHDTAIRSLRHDQIFGYSMAQPEWGAKIFFNHILPVDRDIAKKSFEEALVTGNLKLECRIMWPDRSIHWIDAHGRVYFNEQKKPVTMMGVVIDINERKIATDLIQKKTEELEKKNIELKKLDLLKNDFVNNVSHELRTPLTVIKEIVALLYDGTIGPILPKQKDLLETAKRNVDRLARMIDNSLDYQKLDAQKVEYNTAEWNINTIVKEVGEGFKLLSTNKGLNLKFQLQEDLPLIKFDNDKIVQVLTNLLNNAIKFTPKGGICLITEKEGNNAIKVSIKDEGIGVKEEDLNKLFHTFSQISSSAGYHVGGTGLGLALCKKIIEGHQGKIGVVSEFGQGSTFYFILPIEERRV